MTGYSARSVSIQLDAMRSEAPRASWSKPHDLHSDKEVVSSSWISIPLKISKPVFFYFTMKTMLHSLDYRVKISRLPSWCTCVYRVCTQFFLETLIREDLIRCRRSFVSLYALLKTPVWSYFRCCKFDDAKWQKVFILRAVLSLCIFQKCCWWKTCTGRLTFFRFYFTFK